MNKLPERIRIKDIARLADVSVGTVDRVLHGRTGVAEASRKLVEEILKQLDYQPNICLLYTSFIFTHYFERNQFVTRLIVFQGKFLRFLVKVSICLLYTSSMLPRQIFFSTLIRK